MIECDDGFFIKDLLYLACALALIKIPFKMTRSHRMCCREPTPPRLNDKCKSHSTRDKYFAKQCKLLH